MTDLDKIARRFLKLRAMIDELESKKDALRPQLEAALLKAKENTREMAGRVFSFKAEFCRRFDEKKARLKLGDDLVDSLYKSSSRRSLRIK